MPKLKIILFLAFVISGTIIFQNCSQFSKESPSTSSYSSDETPVIGHLDNQISQLPSQQMRLVNRRYVTELFRDIFTASNGETATNLEGYLFAWATKRGAQLGGGCDVVGSTTGIDCNNDISNANQPSHADPNTIRESFKIQLCEELLGQDVGLKIVLNKLGVTDTTNNSFTTEKFKLAYELFYRTDEMPSYYSETLKGFAFDLQQNQETTANIWRGILLLICETPEWQKL